MSGAGVLPWSWPVAVTVLFLATLLFLWIAVTLYHWHGRFRMIQMWVPVLAAPVTVVVGLLALAVEAAVLAYLILLAVAVLGGLAGFAYHLRGALRVQGEGILLTKLTRIPVFLPLVWAFLFAVGFYAGLGLKP